MPRRDRRDGTDGRAALRRDDRSLPARGEIEKLGRRQGPEQRIACPRPDIESVARSPEPDSATAATSVVVQRQGPECPDPCRRRRPIRTRRGTGCGPSGAVGRLGARGNWGSRCRCRGRRTRRSRAIHRAASPPADRNCRPRHIAPRTDRRRWAFPATMTFIDSHLSAGIRQTTTVRLPIPFGHATSGTSRTGHNGRRSADRLACVGRPQRRKADA